jgi:hypothetical protein
MTPTAGRTYNWAMRRAVLLALMLAAAAGRASADPAALQTGTAPVVNILLRSGSVTIKTWNRDEVQVEAGPGVSAQHLDPRAVEGRIPRQIPAWSQAVQTVRGVATLAAETWIVPPLAPVPHDGVIVRGDGDATVTIPNGTALLLVHTVGKSGISLDGYRDGVFFLNTRAGAIGIHDVSGTGFLGTIRGAISATNSSFDRLRARNATGTISFVDCAAQQIEVTSFFGSIVYDNGSFAPGLARFESQNGDVALGISGNAQIGAHSESGSVATEFSGHAVVKGTGGDTRAAVGSGGASVTASSGSGTILLYDGSLGDHANLARRAPRLRNVLQKAGSAPNKPARARKGAARPYRV